MRCPLAVGRGPGGLALCVISPFCVIQLRVIPSRIHLFFALSLLVHAMLAAIPLSKKLGEGASAGVPMPMVVRLLDVPKAAPELSVVPPDPMIPQPKVRPEPVRKWRFRIPVRRKPFFK